MKNRRDFIVQSAMAAAGLYIPSVLPASQNTLSGKSGKKDGHGIAVFSKNLQWLDYKELAETARSIGFDAIDLTVRPGGHVEPAQVTTDLPKAVEVIRKAGLDVSSITTGIVSAGDRYTEPVLKAASKLGIPYYRTGWFTYDKKIGIPENLDRFKSIFLQLQEINKAYTMHGAYQNHAGDGFGAAVIDLWMAMKDTDPKWIGCQYDIRHATVEGAYSWPVGLGLLHDRVRTINVKDFRWQEKAGKWQEENVPLGTGMVNFKSYFELLKQLRFNGPICIHFEYPLGGAEGGSASITIPKEEVIKAMKRDLEKLKDWTADLRM